jgi:hypothetical protein
MDSYNLFACSNEKEENTINHEELKKQEIVTGNKSESCSEKKEPVSEKFLCKKSKRKNSKNEYFENVTKCQKDSLNIIFDKPIKFTIHENENLEPEYE